MAPVITRRRQSPTPSEEGTVPSTASSTESSRRSQKPGQGACYKSMTSVEVDKKHQAATTKKQQPSKKCQTRNATSKFLQHTSVSNMRNI